MKMLQLRELMNLSSPEIPVDPNFKAANFMGCVTLATFSGALRFVKVMQHSERTFVKSICEMILHGASE
jgi:hypothetical protein